MMINIDTTVRSVCHRGISLGVGLLILVLVFVACDSEDLGDANAETPTVGDYVTEVTSLSTLDAAVQEADLSEELEREGITLFAPLNSAFEPSIDPTLNQEVLRRVVRHHVVSGEVTTDQLSDGQSLSPDVGAPLAIGVGENVTVNRATVTNADANAANGVVHVIDGLLADALDRTILTPQFTIFARLVGEANLESVLRSAGSNDGRTIFVPTNAVLLDALDSDDSGQIENHELPSNLDEILQHHVLDRVYLSGDIPTSETAVSPLEGPDLTVNRDEEDGSVTVGSGNESTEVSVEDVEVDNGVIHGIDTVLLP